MAIQDTRKSMGQMRFEHWGHVGASVWNFEGSPNSPGASTGAGSAQITERWAWSSPWFCSPFSLPSFSRPFIYV